MFPYRISVPILEFKESIQEEASCLGNLVTQNLISRTCKMPVSSLLEFKIINYVQIINIFKLLIFEGKAQVIHG